MLEVVHIGHFAVYLDRVQNLGIPLSLPSDFQPLHQNESHLTSKVATYFFFFWF